MPKTKLTGFSRLLLFLIFFVPVAYFGASYYNGEDPVANLKALLGTEQTTAQTSRNENARLKRDLAIANEKLARCQTAGVQ